MDGYDGMFGKNETGARQREAGEDQAGHDREERHAGEDFYRRNDMPVMSLRMHVAIADGRQRFDREVEQAKRPAAGDVGNWVVAEPVKKREYRIQRDEDCRRRREEDRPVDRHRAVIEVGPKVLRQAAGFDFAATKENDLRSALASRSDFFHNLSQNG